MAKHMITAEMIKSMDDGQLDRYARRSVVIQELLARAITVEEALLNLEEIR